MTGFRRLPSRRRFGAALALGTIIAAVTAPAAGAGLLVTANDDAYTVGHDRVLSVAASGLLANDTGLAPAASKTSNPGHGTVTVNANGGFTYRPAAGYVGADSFTYQASVLNLGILVTDPATVRITVTNAAPVAVNDTYTATTGLTLTIPAPGVLGNDTDADGDTLTTSLVDSGGNGSLSLAANGGFTFTSGGSFTGSRTFTYRASDGAAQSGIATVTIVVSAPAPTPTATPTPTPTPAPTPAPTPTPTPTPTPRPTATPILPVPSLPPPSVPLPSLPLPSLPPPGSSATPKPTPSPTPAPAAAATASPGPTALPSGSLPAPIAGVGTIGGPPGSGGDPGTGTGTGVGGGGPDGPDRLQVGGTVPGVDLATSGVVGLDAVIEWAVPAIALTVPGLLLVVIVLAQMVGGVIWLPVARRWLGSFGIRNRQEAGGPSS